MFFQNINYWTVAIAALLSVGLGFVWYSPWLFGKRFMKETGMTPEKIEEFKRNGGQRRMMKNYGLTALFSLVSALVVAGLLNSLIVTGISGLLVFAVLLWLAFSMPVAANHVIFGDDSFVLFLINTGYQLVSIALVTLVIGIWG